MAADAVCVTKEIGRRISKAVGLDPSKVRFMSISFAPDEAVIADVQIYLSAEELELLGLELKQSYGSETK